jgi:hypothetical protein
MLTALPVIGYGRVRCNACGDFYDIDEGHTCPSAAAAALLPVAVVDAATVPDPATLPDPDADEPDRTHPAGLTWVEPLVPRPIALGPSAEHPELRPVLDIQAARFWTNARHGLAIGRAEIAMDQALTAAPSRAYRVRVAETSDCWNRATTNYAKELAA